MIRYRGGRDRDGRAVVSWVLLEDHREVGQPELLPSAGLPWDWGEGDASALVDGLLTHALGELLVCHECGGANTVLHDVDVPVPCPLCGGQGATPSQIAAYGWLRQLLLNRMWAMPRAEPWTISDLELHDLWQLLLTLPPPEPDV